MAARECRLTDSGLFLSATIKPAGTSPKASPCPAPAVEERRSGLLQLEAKGHIAVQQWIDEGSLPGNAGASLDARIVSG